MLIPSVARMTLPNTGIPLLSHTGVFLEVQNGGCFAEKPLINEPPIFASSSRDLPKQVIMFLSVINSKSVAFPGERKEKINDTHLCDGRRRRGEGFGFACRLGCR